MNKPVIFKTPGGEEMVILSRADYDALTSAAAEIDPEDAADIAVYDAAKARLASGEDRPLTPQEMAPYYLRPGFLRGARKASAITQIELAAKVGIGQGHLSDIEAGRRKGAPETMRRIATALGVSIAPLSNVAAGEKARSRASRSDG